MRHVAGRLASGLVPPAIAVLVAACGGSGGASAPPRAAAASQPSPGSNVLAAPPIPASALEAGPPPRQIAETIVAFYRAAWENQPDLACGLFSPAGRAGFMKAAKTSFPMSVNSSSPCTHAMQIYSATLGQSVNTTQGNDPSFSAAALNNVAVADIEVHGRSATALAPMNVAQVINPKRIYLVHSGRRWLIDGSQSLNASNLLKILKRAEARGQLQARKR